MISKAPKTIKNARNSFRRQLKDDIKTHGYKNFDSAIKNMTKVN